MRKYSVAFFCNSTVVNGSGFHFLVGFSWTLVTMQNFASKQRSKRIVTTARSKSRFRFQEKLTLISSRVWVTFIDQNGSGLKPLTRR